jgi:SNF2 family DNA or RNA helicase
LIIAPASVRAVWFDPELGELKKHLWDSTPAVITEYHARRRSWETEASKNDKSNKLHIFITNFEFVRSKHRLEALLPFCTAKTLLVLDEASAVKGYKTAQTKACMKLRQRCGRVVLLNGTPIANSPLDMFSQGNLLDPRILATKSYFHFRARYALMGGWMQKAIVGFQNLEDMQARFKPYVLRRLKSECLDLPEKLPPVTLTATLTSETWKIYKQMRDDMIAWLSASTVAVSMQAGVKAMRLSQITAGFLGGVEDAEPDDLLFDDSDDSERPEWLSKYQSDATTGDKLNRSNVTRPPTNPTQEIGREKLNLFLEWLDDRLVEDPNLKLLAWCRFRPEVARLLKELDELIHVMPNLKTPEAIANWKNDPKRRIQVGAIWGGQTKDRFKMVNGERILVKMGERNEALRLLDPRTMPEGPVIVVGTPASGSMGINLSGAHTVIYISNDFSLKNYLQSADRVHRPGQVHAVSYTEMIATGPDGQKTVDHTIIKALRNKENIATWTTSAWIAALQDE